MTHCKTSKRVYKKRATKKAINGGGVCDIICPNNKKNEEEEPNEEEKEEEEPNEEEKEEEEEEPTKEQENKGSIFGAGGKKSRKHKSRKGARKTAKKPKSAWTTFVTKLYKKKKLTNPLYMFKDALKDAAKLYKK